MERSDRDLATVGELTAELATVDVNDQAERALDWTRDALKVEASEIFLVEPGEHDMLLSYFSGESESAFSEIERFRIGTGFPGLVLDKGETIATSDLASDKRYLRERVKAEGFRSYVCVPLRDESGVVGALNVASRRTDLDIDRAGRILNWVGTSVSRALENTSLKARLAALTPFATMGVSGALQRLSLEMLEKMMAVGGANAGELKLFHPKLRGLVHRVTSGPFCEEVNPAGSLTCPALAGDLGIALIGDRNQWPEQCRHLTSDADVVQCLPLIADGRPVGLIQLQYESDGPRPATKHVAVLHSIAVQAAGFLKQAWDAEEHRDTVGQDSSSAGRESIDGSQRAARTATNEDSGTPRLDIRCFGSFDLVIDGRQIPPESVQRRGAITLLKMLVVNHGHAITRDAMAEAIWPDADPEVIANRIHVLIHALRQVVEPSGNGRRRSWTFIRNDGDRYYLNPDASYRSDVQDFRRMASEGDRYEAQGDASQAVRSYEEALALYTGDLLDDEPYAEWCWAEREHLRETALNVAVKLAGQHFQQQEFDKSISYYRRALHIDPLREEIHRGLIATLIAADQRAEAIRQYHVCCETLQGELGVDPLPETRRLIYSVTHDLR